jgi:hypothetical protein
MRFVGSTLVCVTILFAACRISDPHSEQSEQVDTSLGSTDPPQDTVQRTSAESASSELPSNALIVQIAHVVDSLGWTSDTARLKKVFGYGQFKDAVTVWGEGRPFYRLAAPYEHAQSWNTLTLAETVDPAALSPVEGVWAYFYRHASGTKNIPDGVIEVWEFPTDSTALNALQAFVTAYPFPYMNTMPQYFSSGNFLVIGNTRASNDSYNQRDVFKVLRERFPVSDFYPKKS